jgi:flavin-dependent dehydrogenase
MGPGGRITTDICIIGGGPAGSTVAHQLATLGHDVCLLEREASPRCRIGASLPSSIVPLLRVLGTVDCVERAGFLRARHMLVRWAAASPGLRNLPEPLGFHVDRGTFDNLLLLNAEARGVRVLRPAHARPPRRLGPADWRIGFDSRGQSGEVSARLVVDASGGHGILPGQRRRASAPLLALYAYWRTVGTSGEGRIEAGRNEWFWCAPISERKAVAAVFLDPKRLSRIASGNTQDAYQELLRGFTMFDDVRAECMEGRAKACDASSRFAENPAGADFARVGDASISLDPLSSQGIQSAIASGIQAAIVLNTLLESPANAEAAITFYRQRQQEKVRQHAAKTAGFYREQGAVCDSTFWRLRSVTSLQPKQPQLERDELDPTCEIRLSDTATIKATPIVRGNLIVSAPALHHDALERPVAFIDQVEICPLLRHVRSGRTPQAIVHDWCRDISADSSWDIMAWLWHHKVVVPLSTPREI